jgi:tetratricopeptide (TPR) repeat protein
MTTNRTLTSFAAFGIAAAALSFTTLPSIAAGSSSGEKAEKVSCPSGQVYDKNAQGKDGKKGSCVEKSASLSDDIIYDNGEALALAGRYGEAIDMLTLASNRNDPRILNYLGYSHRKLGRIQVGLGYYREALRLDSEFTLARSYMGEAFLMLDDVASAKEQLAMISEIVGTDAREYRLLNTAIEAHERGETAWN